MQSYGEPLQQGRRHHSHTRSHGNSLHYVGRQHGKGIEASVESVGRAGVVNELQYLWKVASNLMLVAAKGTRIAGGQSRYECSLPAFLLEQGILPDPVEESRGSLHDLHDLSPFHERGYLDLDW